MPLPSGQTLQKVGETLLIGAIGGAILTYVGMPAGLGCFKIARKVFEEMGI